MFDRALWNVKGMKIILGYVPIRNHLFQHIISLRSSFSSPAFSSSTMATMRFHSQFWFLLLLFIFFFYIKQRVDASHEVFGEFQSLEAPTVDNHHKTVYHFRPPKNWINDPNAPMYFNGIYHFLYQYNPKGSVWGDIVWAHAVSTDLINWKIIEPAIYPSKRFDINGCWSGSATILPTNKLAILYTGIDARHRQVQNIVFPRNLSDPYLRQWYKPYYNPIMRPVDGINASAFRDPTTGWRGSDGIWRTIVGSQVDLMGIVILYKSKDFIHWKRASHPLHSANNTGMWECPDFFPVSRRGKRGLDTSVNNEGSMHVLKVSLDITRYDYYTIGTYQEQKDEYIPNENSIDNHTGLRYDYGNFYASKSFFDERKKRRVLWGWANESDLISDDVAKGWAGIQTIPRTLWLDRSGRQLVQWPVEEIESLRGKEVEIKNLKLKHGSRFEVKGVKASQADVEVAFKVSGLEKSEPFDPSWLGDPEKLCTQKGASVPGKVGPFGLLVLASSNLTEYTAVFFRVFKSKDKYVTLMCSDATRSSLRPELYKPSFGVFVDIDIERSRKISLRSLIDRSAVESFGAKGKTCITSRVYPTFLSKKAKVHLFAFNYGSETVDVSNLKAWEMRKASIKKAK